jgi:trans-AT polyketide synthase/acyltransferase/oxidoreductase domain-containing protein
MSDTLRHYPSASTESLVGNTAGLQVLSEIRRPLRIFESESAVRSLLFSDATPPHGGSVIGVLPALYPEWLGDRSFGVAHGVRFPYIAGEMARGIASAQMVCAIARAGALGFFGAAGLATVEVEDALSEIERALGPDHAFGVNLIHSPQDPKLEDKLVDIFLTRRVRRVSASAFMKITPALVRYSASGLRYDMSGRVVRTNHLFAKISREEVAAQFVAPPPAAMLAGLVQAGGLTEDEANIASRVPLASDLTAESDSGGHTDNRPLSVLLPLIRQQAEEAMQRHRYDSPIRVGAAGGLGTPQAVAAAFALGAAYVMTGTVNQATVESGLCEDARALLATAGLADTTMAPSADMFELGVKVQVLKKGTMFAQRATRLYELYRRYSSLDAIPATVREQIERDIFRRSLDEIWADTKAYFARLDPAEIDRAERDPHHRMALVFRWYLGSSSRWPITGETSRRLDYQIWCGPAIGGFNAWTQGSFLAEPQNRTVVQVALNLLEGAAVLTRAHQARCFGVDLPEAAFHFAPRRLS